MDHLTASLGVQTADSHAAASSGGYRLDAAAAQARGSLLAVLAASERAEDDSAYDGRDAELLPEGDASEFDELDEPPVGVPAFMHGSAEHPWDRDARARELTRLFRDRRILGRIVRVDRVTMRALVRAEPEQPDIAPDLLDRLPESFALDLHEKAYTAQRLAWLRAGEGRLIKFSFHLDDELTPKASHARDASER